MINQRRKQPLPALGQLVVDPEIEATVANQSGVQGGLEVLADRALSAFEDQAHVANAELPGLAQQEQDRQAGWVAQAVGQSGEPRDLGRLGELLAQGFRLALVLVFGSQIGVAHA